MAPLFFAKFALKSFLSLIGSPFLSLSVRLLQLSRRIFTSVPYRGITFLNFYGDDGVRRYAIGFPFPTGESHFLIHCKILRSGWCDRVSVPYRGITFLNPMASPMWSSPSWVSVPYRGITFLNIARNCDKELEATQFPSPTGESHFLMQISEQYPRAKFCFRPLPGNHIS